MQQVLQDIHHGRVRVVDVPEPLVHPGKVLIANECSVISAGTEKMTIDLARKSLLGKARARPDQVRRVLEKLRNEGLISTVRQVREKLDAPMTMGYSAAGMVLACGKGVQALKPGDRVASNGPHAEVVCVAQHLCARVPESVPLDQAAFATLGAIAMQGVRLAKASIGETVFVVGLGLVGQIAVGILNAAGCRVLGTDPDPERCRQAVSMGALAADSALDAAAVQQLTGGLGADAVLIAASTNSNGPIELAAAAVRQKGRVILVGVVGLELDRRPFYFKEIEFAVSCSYGPGRYDPAYEEDNQDYPAAHVRWTAQRNMQAVLELVAEKKLDLLPLVSHRLPIERAEEAYALIDGHREPFLGIVLTYPPYTSRKPAHGIQLKSERAHSGQVGIGVLGAGNFAKMVLLPAIRKCPQLHPVALCSAGGVSAAHSGQKHGFQRVTADEDAVFNDPQIEAVFCLTRHNEHARHVVQALRAGKHVFVEKPLCLTADELAEIEAALNESEAQNRILMVGFNRRFSPAALMVRDFFARTYAPLTISVRFNAGPIAPDDWTQNESVGGGRLIGEACHGIDLATFLAGAPPVRVFAESVGGAEAGTVTDDQCYITLRHANGCISNIAYLSGGDRAFPKERIEVFGGGQVAVIDDFRKLTTCSKGKTVTRKIPGADKGHAAQIRAFAAAIAGGTHGPISWTDLKAVGLASILAVQSLREGAVFEIPAAGE